MSAAPERHARLTQLFGEAIELGTTARADLLAQVRAEDRTLGDELAALLDADAQTGATALGMLNTGGLEQTIAASPGSLARSSVVDITGYRVTGVIGSGGMGTVYAAEQTSPRRRVAIKVLHARSAAALARFYAEAEIMARLDHPNITRVLESGDSDGVPYLVMEHIDGVTLDEYVKAEQPPLARRLELFAAICEAVHHTHLHGVIHRDLKPSNVMVRPDGRVIVVDFGVARITNGSLSETPNVTSAGELIGTPLYMSPEQAKLRPHEVDARSDVYSLGVVLFELVSGDLPYDIRGRALPDVTRVICEAQPRALALRDGTIRHDLRAIAGKALAKEPQHRYQSAAAFADDVRNYVAGLQVSARTPGTVEQLIRFAKRRPAAAAIAAGALAAMVGFAVIITALWLEARTARRSADTARAAADTARAAAEQARDELAARTDQLTLRQARTALGRDPTEALGWLRTVIADHGGAAADHGAADQIDPDVAWMIADEAVSRGVAQDVLRGHDDEAHWVDGLPDGGLVSGGFDGRVLIWGAGAAPPHELFRSKHGRIHVAQPSPDGAQIAIGGDGGALHVVATAGGKPTALAGHGGDVERVAWSRDGKWLATGDHKGGVWLWPTAALVTGRKLVGPDVAGAAVESFAAARDSSAVIAGDDHGDVWWWSAIDALDSGSKLAQVDGTALAVWSDGARLVAVDAAGNVVRWQIARDAHGAARAVDRKVTATGEPLKHAAIAPSGDWALLGGVSGTITRVALVDAPPAAAAVDTVSGSAAPAWLDRIERLPFEHRQIRAVAISDDGMRMATGDDEGAVQLWDLTTHRHLALLGHTARIRHLAFAAGGNILLSCDREGIVRRWNLGAVPPRVLDGHRAAIEGLAVSADHRALGSVDTDGVVWLWDLASGGGRAIGRANGRVEALAVHGDTVVTGTTDGDLAWWRPVDAAGDARQAPTTPLAARKVKGIIRGIAFSPDGTRVAVASHAGPITIYDGAGALIAELPGHPRGAECIAFDPSGRLLASGGQDRVVRTWHVLTGAPAADLALTGPTGDVRVIAFAPNGEWLVAAGNDGQVRAWTVRDGVVDAASVRTALTHTGQVTALGFDPGSRWLASSGRDHQVKRVALGADGKDAKDTKDAKPESAAGEIATALALAADGEVEIATERNGADVWLPPAAPVASIDRDVRAALAIGGDDPRLVLGMADGAIVISGVRRHSLADVRRIVH